MSHRLRAYGRFLIGLPGYLNTPISYETACSTIRRRLDERKENFLRMVQRCVYENAASPYLALLGEAQCEYGDMVAHLAQHPLESLLIRLAESGVRIRLDEYKGRAPIVRSGRSFSVRDTDFDNPVLTRGLALGTGGSTGRPTRTLIDLEFLADRACYEHVMFRMLDLHGVPMALWYPKVPASIGLVNCLRYAKVGKALDRWFDMALDRNVLPAWHAWAVSAIVGVSRFAAIPIPRPVRAPLNDPGIVIDWIVDALRRAGRCAVQSNVSGILRLRRAAAARAVGLAGVQFITGSEPLTPARHAEIVSSHAAVYQRYHAVDLGSIAGGCGAADVGDDLHLFLDTVAAVSPEGPSGEEGSAPLCLTSILGRGPKVIINVDLGDRAVMTEHRCACPYDDLGFHLHLSQIRSASRSTAEGIALPYSELVRISEHVLPGLLKASALDFQWVEEEDPNAGRLTRIWLRIAPEVGPVDEVDLRARILVEIGRGGAVHGFYAQLLDSADTLRILREPPRTTPSGKTPPVIKGTRTGASATPDHRHA
jgi:hypothetical protein